jgi:folate-dependent phosphoribosylglycinamide formyltransferase PurN
MRIGILTSIETRHRYFANALQAACEVSAICYQETGYVPASTAAAEIDDSTAACVKHHFEERRRQEEIYFSHNAGPVPEGSDIGVRRVDKLTLNTPATLQFLRNHGVEAVVVYGTGLIKEPLLSHYAGRLINMHLGLSPYYRGTATNFYPLLNDEPEYVGATIHAIDAGIDSGPIYRHARPDITADDMPHTAGNKAILAGIEAMLKTLREMEAGTLAAVPQWKPENPRLYLRKDYHPRQVVQLYELIEGGLFPRYAARKANGQDAIRLVD